MQSHKALKKILLSLLFLSLFITIAYPATTKARSFFDSTKNPLTFEPQVGIPGVYEKGTTYTLTKNDTSYIAEMIKGFYNYGIGIAGLLATIMLMAGGLIWLTSAGSSEKITQAKNLMSGSVIGLVILFGSWMLLRTINPALVDFRIRDIKGISTISDILICSENKGPITVIFRDGVYKNKENEIIKGTQCKEKESCVKTAYINSQDVFECKSLDNIRCCQYKKNATTGITCQTMIEKDCPLIRNNNELDKVYEGVECNGAYNDSGRNPCVSPK
jgi:hypothetical protein